MVPIGIGNDRSRQKLVIPGKQHFTTVEPQRKVREANQQRAVVMVVVVCVTITTTTATTTKKETH